MVKSGSVTSNSGWRAEGSALDAASLEVPMVQARRRVPLPAVLAPDARLAVCDLGRAGQPLEADLADLHPVVQGDGQVRHVRELEGKVPLPARVDVARGGVDQEAKPPQARLALEPGHEVVGERYELEGRTEHELAGMQDERIVTTDLDQLGQLRLIGSHVDVRVAAVAEDPEAAIEVQIHARRLDRLGDERVDHDPPRIDLGPDVPVGED